MFSILEWLHMREKHLTHTLLLMVALLLMWSSSANAYVTFGPATHYGTGQDPRAVATGDFNRDGRKDIVVANYNSNTISILFGSSDGTYQAAVNYPVGSCPLAVVVGDFNADGKLDLAVANSYYASNTVSILTGNGDGTFQAAVNLYSGSAPGGIAADDFNGDGKLDLAVANLGDNTISILLGNGNATFQTAVSYLVGSAPSSVATGDFDGDGTPDIAVTNYNDGSVSILKGNGNGTFRTGMSYAVLNKPRSVAVADLNRDGRLDLVIANYFSGSVSVLLGIGGGDFQPSTNHPTAGYPSTVAIGDFNGDGIPDVAVSKDGVSSSNVVVLLGNGTGTFSSSISLQADNTGAYAVAADDMNGDGKTDLVVGYYASNRISVLLNTTAVDFFNSFVVPPVVYPYLDSEAVLAADFNRDGNLDLVVGDNNGSANNISLLLGSSDGTFSTGTSTSVDYRGAVTTGDFNRDGKMDIAVAHGSSNRISVHLGNGNGTFQSAVYYSAGSFCRALISGDFNGDGVADLAVANGDSNDVSILLGSPDGSFATAVSYGAGTGPSDIVAGDFNQDGKIDLATSNFGSNDVSLFLGNGDGTFQPAARYTTASWPTAIAAGDFNGDGKLDLAAASFYSVYSSILLGNGDGTFGAHADYISANGALSSITVGDFNRDGKLDIAAISSSNNELSIVSGNGDGTFQRGQDITWENISIHRAVAGDFNRDGWVDLAVTSDKGVIVLLNLDVNPDSFTFVDQTDINLSTLVTSNGITVTGISSASPISIAGGEYSINGGAYTSAAGSVNNGDTVTVRQFSSSNFTTTTCAVLTVGSVSGAFHATTRVPRTTPDPFAFTDQIDMPLNMPVISNAITVSGVEAPTTISVTGAEYSINGGVCTSAPGFINTGDAVTVRLTSSPNYSATTSAVLTIGGVNAVFNVTTLASDGGTCAILVPTVSGASGSSINDLGEIVFSRFDLVTGFNQIYSSTRGQLTADLNQHVSPSLNNRGDVVWEQSGQIYGLISGQLTQLSHGGGAQTPSINDFGDVVWSQFSAPMGRYQIYSLLRGAVTIDWADHLDPAINNRGEIVWVQPDSSMGFDQIYEMMVPGGGAFPITYDIARHMQPAISNSGEVVWGQADGAGNNRIYSSTRGQLTYDCPAGTQHSEPSVNACGDLTFTNFEANGPALYRLGNNTPCSTEPEPNNTQQQATSVSNNSTTTGLLDASSDMEDWYNFTANAGDQIKINVNWNPTPPNMLVVELYDGIGTMLMSMPGPASPIVLNVTAQYSGTYSVRLFAPSGRFGYNLSIKVGLDGGLCADLVSEGFNEFGSSINDLGEMVWVQRDLATLRMQIYSSVRGYVTGDQNDHWNPSLNSRGDVVWEQTDGMYNNQIFGLISGVVTQITSDATSHGQPVINDSGEVVWYQADLTTGRMQIYSNLRGRVTSDQADHYDPSLNNRGDIVWGQYDPATSQSQIYGIIGGTLSQITNDAVMHGQPSISNSGEIVWSQADYIYSNTRGQLTRGCPSGVGHGEPSVNACGDIAFTNFLSGFPGGLAVYRLGNNTPCSTEPEPNNTQQQAVAVGSNSSTTGLLDSSSDMEDWYSFTANAGDQIKIDVNWNPTPPNMLVVELYDSIGTMFMSMPGPASPIVLNVTAQYSGTYSIRLFAPSGRFGYNLSIKVGLGGGLCADPVTAATNAYGSSINDLGEMVWSQYDSATGVNQIYSSTRGQLTTDTNQHMLPSLNNQGDVVWEQNGLIYGLISGQLTQLNYNSGAQAPSLNDFGDVVWSQLDSASNRYQIYSLLRGAVTSDQTDHWDPAVNNRGDVVWVQPDSLSGFNQIYGIIGGTLTRITNDATMHMQPSISNTGEVVWMQPDSAGNSRIYSSTRGQLTHDCPSGFGHNEPSVNACGDLTFTNYSTSGGPGLYRLGSNSPCSAEPEPNDNQQQATSVGNNSSTTGLLDSASDMEDWYSFTATTGDPIKVSVNWNSTPPNMLQVELYDGIGTMLMSMPGPVNPIVLNATAQYSGTYYVRLIAPFGGRFGYSLKIKVGLGGGQCADSVSTGATYQFGGSINDIGEIVWSQSDSAGFEQIYSNLRGRITVEPTAHTTPSINNRGDVVWEQNGQIFGLLSGQLTQLTNGPVVHYPAINDFGEVVWSQLDPASNRYQVYSLLRGALTSDQTDHWDPAINNRGDLVWVQQDLLSGFYQIYGIIEGTQTQITNDAAEHMQPSISNSGEVVWIQLGNDGQSRVLSSTRGQLTHGCPSGYGHYEPSVNSCGDIAFTNFFEAGSAIYRLGNNTPCSTEPEPNNTQQQAVSISGNSTSTGMLDSSSDMEDWYSFTAKAQDPVKAYVNWNSSPPNMLLVELYDSSGTMIMSVPGSAGPIVLNTTAQYTGTYSVRLFAPAGRFGYNLSLAVGDITPPAVGINPVVTPTNVNTQTISGTREADAAISVSVNTLATIGTVTYATATTWACQITNLAEGINSLTVTATDAAGNSAVVTAGITYDSIPPAVTINPVTSPTKVNMQTITGNREADAAISVSVNTSATVGLISYPTPNSWTSTISNFAEGVNVITVTAADIAGNIAAATTGINYDSLPPAVSINAVLTPTKLNSQTIDGTREADAAITVTVNTAAAVGSINYLTATTWSCQLTNLNEGANIITVSAADAAGNNSAATTTIAYDSMPPAVAINPVVTPTKLNSQTISGTRESDSTITVGVNSTAAAGLVTYPTTTSWTCLISTMAEGDNDITVTATDGAGNSASVSANITYDNIPPMVAINPVATPTNVGYQTITGTRETDAAISVSASTVAVVGQVTYPTAATWTCFLTNMAEGVNIVTVRATDQAGNIGSTEASVIVDTVPPTVTIDPVTTPTNANTQTIGGSREQGAVIIVSVDTTVVPGPVIYPTETTWSCAATGLVEGLNTFTITAKDGAQNIATATASIIYDSIAPLVNISLPVAAATKDNTPRLEYTITDGTTTTVSVNGVAVSKISGQDLDPLADGSYTVRVESSDQAGNVGFAEVSFVVDTVPPAVGISPVSTPTNLSAQTITGSRESGAVVTVAMNTPAAAGTVSYPSDQTWSCAITGLAEGGNIATVTTTDAAGNSAVTSVSITYDSIAPVVSITSPAAGSTINNRPTLVYTANDGVVTVLVDGVVINKVSDEKLDALANGAHTVRVEARDAANNVGIAEVVFTVNYTPLAVLTSSLGWGVAGTSYSQTVSANGGVPPYAWSISDGSLPLGLSLDSATGVISGVPSSSGAFTFTVQVQDGNQTTAAKALAINVYSPLVINTTSLAAGYAGELYAQTVTAQGGLQPYAWSISSGSLPGGLTLDAATGVISGTPTGAGTSSFTVQVQDANQTTNTADFTIAINAARPDLVVTSVSGPSSGRRGYRISVSATVKNQGNATSPSSTVTLYLSSDSTVTTSDIRLSDKTVNSLTAGSSQTISTNVTIPSTTPRGTYYIGAISDRTGVVTESDESNNSKTGNTITVN